MGHAPVELWHAARPGRRVARLVRRPVLLAAVIFACAAGDARAAGEPIMPLRDVRAGMQCTARSVVHGTTISTFDAKVLDIVDGDPAGEGDRVLVRVSGAAIADGGIGPGFSGSPVSCPGADGTPRVMGAISEGIGDYGNDVVLVTPIEQVLAQPVTPPKGVRSRRAMPAGARPLTALTISGLPRSMYGFVRAAAARAGRTVLLAPGGSAARRFAPPPLDPGASVAVGNSTGDLTVGAIGTVTYRDGAHLWAFGHALDGAGLRSLFLQDAYVYGVIGNPIGVGDTSTYKLAAPGHVRGILTGDGLNAVAGTVGPEPASTEVLQHVRDLDTNRSLSLRTLVADETDLGRPDGLSTLTTVAGLGTAAAATKALDGGPVEQSGRMCVRITLREGNRTLGFCDRYAARGFGGADTPGSVGLAAANDVSNAVGLVEGAGYAALHVRRVRVDLNEDRGLRLLRLRSARVPRTVRAGRRIRVVARLRRVHGKEVTRAFTIRLGRSLAPGNHRLVLSGAAEDSSASFDDALSLLFGDSSAAGPPAAESFRELAGSIADLGRFDGVVARVGTRRAFRAYRDPHDLITGRAQVRLHVAR